MYSKIDSDIVGFVSMLQVGRLQPGPNPVAGQLGAKVFDMGEVQDLKMVQADPLGNIVSMFHDVNGVMVGLTAERYSKFKALVEVAQAIAPFDTKCSFSFLEETAFEWLITAYRTGRLDVALSEFLLQRLVSQYRDYTFYIPIAPLSIPGPFWIGRAEFTVLTADFLEEEKVKFVALGKRAEDFGGFMDPFLNQVLVKTKVQGTSDRAKQVALRQSELAVSVLKCFLHEYGVYSQFKIPDLNYRHGLRSMAPLFFGHQSEKFSLEFHAMNDGPAGIVSIDAGNLMAFRRQGLQQFSDLVARPNSTEFYDKTLEALLAFASYVSTPNVHEKVIKIISFFERVLIAFPGRSAKGESILRQEFIPRFLQTADDVRLGIELTNTFYRTRDLYVHNGVETPVDFHSLYKFQMIGFRFLHWMVGLNGRLKTMQEFYFELQRMPKK